MAREVQVLVLCDPCLSQHERNEGHDFQIALTGMPKPRVLSLCETHEKEYYAPLADLLADMGQALPSSGQRPAASTAAAGEQHPCPDPTCPAVLGTKGSLQAHVRQQHGITLSEMLGAEAKYKCEAPDCDAKFTSRQGIAVHTSRTHPELREAQAQGA